MKRQAGNSQMFALRSRPAESILIAVATYRLTKVFKHDFWAATCLYELAAGQDSDTPKIVVNGACYRLDQVLTVTPLALN